MPTLIPATTMAARDTHPMEKMTLGADPYDTAGKASLFHPDMLAHSVLPIRIVFTNDGDETVVLSRARFELVTRDRAKAEPYTLDDLRRAFTAIRAPGSRSEDQIPIPLPGKNKVHGGLSQKDRDELESASFAAHAVEPHASQQAFSSSMSATSTIPPRARACSSPESTTPTARELMYFEVPLGKP